MPPTSPNAQLLPLHQGPRLVLYHQTTHDPSGKPISVLPLIANGTGVTHVIVAAIHLNDGPGNITLNDHPPDHPRYGTLWTEVAWLQGAGVKVMGMLGGAAKGSYQRLSGSDEHFESYYRPLAAIIRKYNLQGLDLDVEEPIPLSTITRLIHRLHADFSTPTQPFIITLAPVATALLPSLSARIARALPSFFGGSSSTPHSLPHLSGFNHFALEASDAGRLVHWYNLQFYNGWGDASSCAWYDAIASLSPTIPVSKLVLGVITNPGNGGGHVPLSQLQEVCRVLRSRYPGFGGVMGWEYFNAGTHERREAWEWAYGVGTVLRRGRVHEVEAGHGIERPEAQQQRVQVQIPPNQLMQHWEREGQKWEAAMAEEQRRREHQQQVLQGGRGGGAQAPFGLPNPGAQWPEGDVERLCELGFGRMEAVRALNRTGGNVEVAAGLLFEDQ